MGWTQGAAVVLASAAFACTPGPAPQPSAPPTPSTTTPSEAAPSAAPSPVPAPSSTPSAQPTASPTAQPTAQPTASPTAPTLAYPPKTGVLDRDGDECGWSASTYWCPPGAACKPTPPPTPVLCPRSIVGKKGGTPAKLPDLGWLERAADGTCWWAKEAPAQCVPDAPCAPLPKSILVLCHP